MSNTPWQGGSMNKSTKEKEARGGAEWVDYADALAALPDKDFLNLTSSKLPLLAYWKKPRPLVRNLCYIFGIKIPKDMQIYLEYAVPSLSLRDYPYCADVMLVSDQLVIAIEGKWTEARDETVGEWLQKGSRTRRENVLRHWLSLIQPFSRNKLDMNDFTDVVFRMLHRTAAACAIPGGKHAIVYQVFYESDDDLSKHGIYEHDMSMFGDLIRPNSNLVIGLQSVIRLIPTRSHEVLKRKLAVAEQNEIPSLVRNALVSRGRKSVP